MNLRSIVAVLALLAVAACAEPLEFADWTIPVPEGTRIIEYAGVPLDERSAEIELVADLTMGGNPNDPNQSFYDPWDIAVAADGRIFVFEFGNRRIQAFNADGEFVRSIGRDGEGPGEIRLGGDIAVAGNRLVLSGVSKISVWTLEGDHLVDSPINTNRALTKISPLPDGWLLGRYSRNTDDPEMQMAVFVGVTLQAGIARTYAEAPSPQAVETIIAESGATVLRLPVPYPTFAASPEGAFYITATAEYQIHAFDVAGTARWALRTAWPRLPVVDADKERSMLRRVDDAPARTLDVDWPLENPALASELSADGSGTALLVDGHGHIYVFPLVRDPIDGRYPVDVFDASGDRLFAGWIALNEWQDALGDFVYRLEESEEDDEIVAIRYALVEPFK